MDQFLAVWNPPNAEPIVLERIDLLADGASCPDPLQRRGGGGTGLGWVHTKVGGWDGLGPGGEYWAQGVNIEHSCLVLPSVRWPPGRRVVKLGRAAQPGVLLAWCAAAECAVVQPYPTNLTQALYRLRPDSRQHLTGMTDDMCRWAHRHSTWLQLHLGHPEFHEQAT